MRDGLRTCGTVEKSADGEGAIATIVTLDDFSFSIRLDLGGVRAESSESGASVPTTVYDSVSSFLINNSPGYKAHFNASLFAALSAVAREREEDDESHAVPPNT